MERVALAAGLLVVAGLIAWRLRPRHADAPTQPHYQVPLQLDRADFEHPDTPWLVVVFSSTVCTTCVEAVAKATVLSCAEVGVQDVSYQEHRALHERYAIEAAPTTVVAGPDGAVHAAFVGVPSATDLWAAVAEARNPGASPEPDLGAPQA